MSDTPGPYDPNAVEGEKSSGAQYVQFKDLRIWAIAFLIFSIPFYFIYKVLEGNSERHRCISNLRAVYQAINLYAGEHDNRFPPLARTEGDGVTPSLSEAGLPYTWVSDVAPLLNKRQTMLCPTATEAETVFNESAESTSARVPSSYGMYAPYGGGLTQLVESPDQVILVAETSNQGARATYDPVPFGKNIPDGFEIGWSNSNRLPNDQTERVTRLAFPGSGTGPTKEGRHGSFIQALTASGELLQLVPEDATFRTKGVSGTNRHWGLPPGYRGPGG